jgi:hypothetical protein
MSNFLGTKLEGKTLLISKHAFRHNPEPNRSALILETYLPTIYLHVAVPYAFQSSNELFLLSPWCPIQVTCSAPRSLIQFTIVTILGDPHKSQSSLKQHHKLHVSFMFLWTKYSSKASIFQTIVTCIFSQSKRPCFKSIFKYPIFSVLKVYKLLPYV